MILKTDGLVLIYGMILKQINKMIADVDKDGSGAIDFDEFVHMMTAKIGERDTKEELTKAFQIIDLDKNVFYSTLNLLHSILISLEIDFFSPSNFQGKISPDDIKRMAKDLGENFTDAEIREMVEEADRDRKFPNLFSLSLVQCLV